MPVTLKYNILSQYGLVTGINLVKNAPNNPVVDWFILLTYHFKC